MDGDQLTLFVDICTRGHDAAKHGRLKGQCRECRRENERRRRRNMNHGDVRKTDSLLAGFATENMTPARRRPDEEGADTSLYTIDEWREAFPDEWERIAAAPAILQPWDVHE